MNIQAKEVASTSMFDVLKYVFSLVLVSAGIVAFYQFSEFSQLYRVLAMVGVVVIALLTMMSTAMGGRTWVFAQEAKLEVRKVVWPSRQETSRMTLLVFGMVIIVGLILWLLDMFLFWSITTLTA